MQLVNHSQNEEIQQNAYENLKRCLRTKNTNAHHIVAELLCSDNPKECVVFCKFMIIFVSQYVHVMSPSDVHQIHKNITTLYKNIDPTSLCCQEAAAGLIDNVLLNSSEKLQQMAQQDHEVVAHMQHGCESHVSCIQVMKSAMCSRSFALLTLMCIVLKEKNASKTIQIIRHMLSCKSFVVQKIQYPDISRLNPSDRHHIVWYCWKALLYCQENRHAERYVRFLLSLFVITYTRKKFLESINLLFHACKLACLDKKEFIEQGNNKVVSECTNVSSIYKDLLHSKIETNGNSISPALMFVPFFKK